MSKADDLEVRHWRVAQRCCSFYDHFVFSGQTVVLFCDGAVVTDPKKQQ
jgi:hypothetical protein